MRKLSDGRTDGQMDGQMDGQTDDSDFIGRCPTNIERSNKEKHEKLQKNLMQTRTKILFFLMSVEIKTLA